MGKDLFKEHSGYPSGINSLKDSEHSARSAQVIEAYHKKVTREPCGAQAQGSAPDQWDISTKSSKNAAVIALAVPHFFWHSTQVNE